MVGFATRKFSLRWFLALLHQLHPLQTSVPVLADNDVVVHGDAQRRSDGDNRLRHLHVRRRRRRVAGRMVVQESAMID